MQTTTNSSSRTRPARRAVRAPRAAAAAGVEVKDLVAPPGTRRGVSPLARDRLSRIERGCAYLRF